MITLLIILETAGCGFLPGCGGTLQDADSGAWEALQPGQIHSVANSLTLRDPLAALNRADKGLEKAKVVFSKEQQALIPPGGHYQGIQCYSRGDQGSYLFLSHDSSNTEAYLVVAGQVSADLWETCNIVIIENGLGDSPYPLKHAGGFQICGRYLAVGVEDNKAKKDSQVIFYDISNPMEPVQLSNLIITRHSEIQKKATSGAVAVIDCVIGEKEGYLIAAGNWDAKDLDFYFLGGDLQELNQEKGEASLFFTWKSEKADRAAWMPDQNWGSYQSINFVRDGADNLFLIGTHTRGKLIGRDFMDLFSLKIGGDLRVMITKVATKRIPLGLFLPCSRGAHFTYGGGIFVPPDGSIIPLATARNAHGGSLNITTGLGPFTRGSS